MMKILGVATVVGLATVGIVAQQNPPQVPSISQRPTGSSLGTIRGGAQDNNIWFGWRVGMPSDAIRGLTLSETLAKSDVMSVTSVEAASTQLTSVEVPKPLDAHCVRASAMRWCIACAN